MFNEEKEILKTLDKASKLINPERYFIGLLDDTIKIGSDRNKAYMNNDIEKYNELTEVFLKMRLELIKLYLEVLNA